MPLVDETQEHYTRNKEELDHFRQETFPALRKTTQKKVSAKIHDVQHNTLKPLLEQVESQSSAGYAETATRLSVWRRRAESRVKSVFSHHAHAFGSSAYTRTGHTASAELRRIGMDDTIQDMHRALNEKLAVGSGTLSLLIISSLMQITHPILMGSIVLGFAYFVWQFGQDAYEHFQETGKIGVAVVDMLEMLLVPLVGYGIPLLIYFILLFISQKILLNIRDRSKQELVNVFGDLPQFVWVQRGPVDVRIPFDEIQKDDTVVVRAGDMIPIDGCIVEGCATVDQHRLTGEAHPAEKEPGDEVLAATMVVSGILYIAARKTGTDTVAAKIGEILNKTTHYRPPLESRGKAVADKATPPTLLVSALSVPLIGPVRALGMLTSQPGYHMRVTAPLSLLNFLKIATARGILIKDAQSLENLREIDTIVFDKTGTLTLEQPHVGAIHGCAGYTECDVLEYAAAVEYRQTHPVALAILKEADTRCLTRLPIQEPAYEVGYGLRGRVNQQIARVGSQRFMAMEGVSIPPELKEVQAQSDAEEHSLVYVAIEHELIGVIELHPTIRPEAARIIAELHRQSFTLAIISGDHKTPTEQLARTLNIDQAFAEVLPEHKAELIKGLQRDGHKVCFVGDGINDAIALKQADLSISLRGASTIATDAADIIFMDGSLRQLPQVFEIGKDFEFNMRNNFIESVIPSILCVGGVWLFGMKLTTTYALNFIFLNAGILNALVLPQQRTRNTDNTL